MNGDFENLVNTDLIIESNKSETSRLYSFDQQIIVALTVVAVYYYYAVLDSTELLKVFAELL